LSPRKDDLHARPTETIEVMKRQKRRKQIKEKQIDLMHCAELIYLSQQGNVLLLRLSTQANLDKVKSGSVRKQRFIHNFWQI